MSKSYSPLVISHKKSNPQNPPKVVNWKRFPKMEKIYKKFFETNQKHTPISKNKFIKLLKESSKNSIKEETLYTKLENHRLRLLEKRADRARIEKRIQTEKERLKMNKLIQEAKNRNKEESLTEYIYLKSKRNLNRRHKNLKLYHKKDLPIRSNIYEGSEILEKSDMLQKSFGIRRNKNLNISLDVRAFSFDNKKDINILKKTKKRAKALIEIKKQDIFKKIIESVHSSPLETLKFNNASLSPIKKIKIKSKPNFKIKRKSREWKRQIGFDTKNSFFEKVEKKARKEYLSKYKEEKKQDLSHNFFKPVSKKRRRNLNKNHIHTRIIQPSPNINFNRHILGDELSNISHEHLLRKTEKTYMEWKSYFEQEESECFNF